MMLQEVQIYDETCNLGLACTQQVSKYRETECSSIERNNYGQECL